MCNLSRAFHHGQHRTAVQHRAADDCAAANFPEHFQQQYQSHLKHLQLKGLQPKTIDAYARGMRRIGEYFSYPVDALSADDLAGYFTALLDSHSWSGVKPDLYGWKFFTEHVLRKPWAMPSFIRPPKVSRLPDIVSVAQAQALFAQRPGAELPGVLLHPVQPGPAPGPR